MPGRTHDRIGPYRILRRLGSGAMGTVYAATDGDDTVALKVIHPHLIERKGFFRRFQREAMAGGRVDHPNVVRTLECDFYVQDEVPLCFLVMEFVEGRTLRDLLAETGPMPETMLRTVAVQIAAGLAAIHEQGIVHRDLKPENILVDRENRMRIMDLGIARVRDSATPITEDGQFAGSLLYAAPEQIRGAPAGPALDQYSLGVILYELATGHNPFRRSETAATMQAHLDVIPPPLRTQNPDVSRFLSELTATLLAKEPERRFRNSTELHDVLAEGERSEWWRARRARPPGPRGVRAALGVERQTRLAGRERELRLLHDAWARAQNGDGAALLLTGEPGVGKSRLVDSFLAEIEGQDVFVLLTPSPGAGGPGALGRTLLWRLGGRAGAKPQRAFADLVPAADPDDPLRDPAENLRVAALARLRKIATHAPLLWIVEDLDRSRPEDRETLAALAAEARDTRCLTLATSGEALAANAAFRRLPVERLGDREAAGILRELFGRGSAFRRLRSLLLPRAAGVPLVLFELVRVMVEDGRLTREEDGRWRFVPRPGRLPVPERIRERVRARLDELGREDRALLDAAAVVGVEFEATVLAGIRRVPRVDVLEQLAAISRRPGLVVPDGARFRFAHPQVRETIYQEMSETLRSEYHGLAGKTISTERETGTDGDGASAGRTACRLVHHLLEGPRPRAALRHLDAALRHLERERAHDALLGLIERVLRKDGLLSPSERSDLRVREGASLAGFGRTADARRSLEDALDLAVSAGDERREARVRSRLGVLLAGDDPGAAADLLDGAARAARRVGDVPLLSLVERSRGDLALRTGRIDDAADAYGEALAAAEAAGDPAARVAALVDLGLVEHRRDRPGAAAARFEAALALAEGLGEPRPVLDVLLPLGRFRHARRDHAAAGACFERARRVAHDLEDVAAEAEATIRGGNERLAEGDPAGARRLLSRGITLAREGRLAAWERIGIGALGEANADLGSFSRALRAFERCLSLSARARDRRATANALIRLAELHARMGDLSAARERLGRAGAKLGPTGWPETRRRLLVTTAEAEELAGRAETALKLAAEASAMASGSRDDPLLARAALVRARALVALDDPGAARALLTGLAGIAGEREVATVAAAMLARLAPDRIADAEAALTANERRLPAWSRMEARYLLARATESREHAEEAYRILCLIRARVPEEHRVEMIRNVGLLRRVAEAAIRARR